MKTLDELGISPTPWGAMLGCFAQNCDPLKLADARLISAAPELYESVCDLLRYFPDGGAYDDERESVRKAIAAVEKAGGAE